MKDLITNLIYLVILLFLVELKSIPDVSWGSFRMSSIVLCLFASLTLDLEISSGLFFFFGSSAFLTLASWTFFDASNLFAFVFFFDLVASSASLSFSSSESASLILKLEVSCWFATVVWIGGALLIRKIFNHY